jgi:hypothetical protein
MQSRRDKSFQDPLSAAGSDALGGVVERALKLASLDRQLRQSLPPELAANCRLANVAGDRLVFLVASPVWKTRLRLHAEDLRQAASQVGLRIREVTAKVATMQPVPPGAAPRLPLSASARDHLLAAAQSIDDPELRARFLELASLP